jgi:hypothetical protein
MLKTVKLIRYTKQPVIPGLGVLSPLPWAYLDRDDAYPS